MVMIKTIKLLPMGHRRGGCQVRCGRVKEGGIEEGGGGIQCSGVGGRVADRGVEALYEGAQFLFGLFLSDACTDQLLL